MHPWMSSCMQRPQEGSIDPKRMPPGATLTRRFDVKQKSKTRPIDDYQASFVNSSVTQLETALVRTVDHIAALVSCALRTAETLGISSELVAKAWGLADAYKQGHPAMMHSTWMHSW